MTQVRESMLRRQRGFSLIELMIALAIVAILLGVALPAYNNSVDRGRQGEAMSALLEGAQALERYYSANGRYTDTNGNLAAVFPTQVPASGTAYYTIAPVSGSVGANAFTLRATRAGTMAGDACGDFELAHTGRRQLSGNTRTVEQCWRR